MRNVNGNEARMSRKKRVGLRALMSFMKRFLCSNEAFALWAREAALRAIMTRFLGFNEPFALWARQSG